MSRRGLTPTPPPLEFKKKEKKRCSLRKCSYIANRRLAWCVQHHVSSRSTILLFYHGSRHSLDIQMEPYINHSL